MAYTQYDYEYLPAVDLQEVERDRSIAMVEADALASVLPLDFLYGDSVVWDQKNDVAGLLPYKPVGRNYPQMNPTGGKRRSVPASHYGGQKTIDARKIIGAARIGSIGEKLNVDGFVSEIQEEFALHEFQMMQYQRGQALTKGIVDILDEDENIVDQLMIDEFSTRTLTLAGGDKWDAPSTSDPVKVLSSLHNLFYRGTGYEGTTRAICLVSSVGRDLILQSAALKAYKDVFGASITDLNQFNKKFNSGHVPQMVEINGTALLKSGAIMPFIDDSYAVVIGYHPSRGTRAGSWTVTSNENAMGEPIIFAETDTEPNHPKLPRTLRSVAGAIGPMQIKQIVAIKFK